MRPLELALLLVALTAAPVQAQPAVPCVPLQGSWAFTTTTVTFYRCAADALSWVAVAVIGGEAGGAAWGAITGTLGAQTDLQTALNGKLTTTGNGSGLTGLTKTQVGLSSVDNTSDASKPVSTATQIALDAKQATLVSGTTIKTINGSTVLGAGDLTVSGSAAWGSVTGTLATQTDLQTALNGKQAAGTYATGTGSATNTNTGDQASIVGITGSLAEFNTALTGADFATGGGTATGVNTGDQSSVTGNAGTATTLQTARTINGVSFNGSANITVPAAADTLTASTLATGVTASSLTSFGAAAAFTTTGAIKSSGTAGVGYATGAGGTVTQATSKATGVTLSKLCGDITLNAAALAAAAIVSFTLTNTTIAAADVLVLNHVTTGTRGGYGLNAQAAAGSALIYVRNNTAASLAEAIVIRFCVVKGALS